MSLKSHTDTIWVALADSVNATTRSWLSRHEVLLIRSHHIKTCGSASSLLHRHRASCLDFYSVHVWWVLNHIHFRYLYLLWIMLMPVPVALILTLSFASPRCIAFPFLCFAHHTFLLDTCSGTATSTSTPRLLPYDIISCKTIFLHCRTYFAPSVCSLLPLNRFVLVIECLWWTNWLLDCYVCWILPLSPISFHSNGHLPVRGLLISSTSFTSKSLSDEYLLF